MLKNKYVFIVVMLLCAALFCACGKKESMMGKNMPKSDKKWEDIHEAYPEGIPKDEFESLIMEYLPVTAKEIQSYVAFDKDKQIYVWERLL